MNIVYRYGLLPPVQGVERVQQQMRAAHAYHNTLLQLERERREKLRQIDLAAGPELFAAIAQRQQELEAVLAEIRRERARTRKRSESADLRAQAKAARLALRGAIDRWKQAVVELRPSAQADRDRANENFLASRRNARPGLSKGQDGIAAGTYQLVEDSAAQSAAMPLWAAGEPNDPRFRRWAGEGFVSQQIVGGLDVDALARSTQVRITDAPDARADSRRKQLRPRVVLWLRVGSGEDRSPVWAQWPMILHRPLPSGARIQRATVRVRRIGPREEWSVEFSLRMADPAPRHGHAVAMDVGWRQRNGSLRLAATCDEHGTTREVVMPVEVLTGLDVPNALRATRDKNLEKAKAELARWLGERDNISDWLREATATLSQWRSPARLAALAIRWRSERFDGDAGGFDPLEAWRKQDRHLWLWETSQRQGALRARKDWFRRVAAGLARDYATLVLEKFDLRQLARRQPADRDAAENETSRTNRVLAAIGEFRSCLRSAFVQRGGRVVEVPAENTTRTCAVCGVVEAFDAATYLRHRCANGHLWDQDENAARNLIERWRSGDGASTDRTPDAPTESRRERVRRLRAEKLVRMGRSQETADGPMATGVR